MDIISATVSSADNHDYYTMSRDYTSQPRRKTKARNSRVKPSRHPLPGWLWLVGGIFIGVLATGLYHSYQGPTQTDQSAANAESVTSETPSQPKHQPRFDFYTLLQESEVVIPDDDDAKPQPKPVIVPEVKKTEAQIALAETVNPTTASPKEPTATEPTPQSKPAETPAPSIAERTVYVLQAGSFKSAGDADSVRASLLLLNMQANIEKVPAGNNQTWHRVLVGPFDTKSELSAAKAILTRNGIDSIQLKRRM